MHEHRYDSETVFGIRIDLPDSTEINECITSALASREPLTITYSHFHILLLARKDARLASQLQASTLNYADGIGAWFAVRFLHRTRPPRINATDFNSELLSQSLRAGKRVFFLGGDRGTAEQLAQVIDRQYPGAEFRIRHGAIDVNDRQPSEEIRQFHPDLLFLGLGTPLQFHWMSMYAADLAVPVMIATGAFFNFAAGTRPRAPRWMRSTGLEWLHRLLHEPGRLWRRYLIGIPAFIVLVVREKLRRGRHQRHIA